MKRLWICLAMLTCCAVPVLTQTTQELVNDGKNTENVTTQSMGYDRKSYSPLKQINKSQRQAPRADLEHEPDERSWASWRRRRSTTASCT